MNNNIRIGFQAHPFLNFSCLEQFTIRNVFSINADILGNLTVSFTNIGLFLIISIFLLFTYHQLASKYISLTHSLKIFSSSVPSGCPLGLPLLIFIVVSALLSFFVPWKTSLVIILIHGIYFILRNLYISGYIARYNMLDSVFSDLSLWSRLLNPLHFLFGPYAILSKIIVNTLLKLLFCKNLTLSQVLTSSFVTGIMGWGLTIFNGLIYKTDMLCCRVIDEILNDCTTSNLPLATGDSYGMACANKGYQWALNLNNAEFSTEIREILRMLHHNAENWKHLPEKGYPWKNLTGRQYGVIKRACEENPALLDLRFSVNIARGMEKYGALYTRGDVSPTNPYTIKTGIGVHSNVYKALEARRRELVNNP